MYLPGTKFKVVLKIQSEIQEFEPGLHGEIVIPVSQMVGKSYVVMFSDGRSAEIHNVIMNNQTKAING